MFIKKAKKLGYKVGLSLKPETDFEELKPFLDEIDYVQLMAIDPGAQGREFKGAELEKIKQLHKIHPSMYIQVDGGVDKDHILKILKAGAKGVVIGSHIFKTSDPAETVLKFKKVEENYATTK